MYQVDDIYKQAIEQVSPFEFDQNVADVFDDMLARSIPYYREVQGLVGDLAGKKLRSNSKVIDLGCSTGTTLALLAKRFAHHHLDLHGVDNSLPMLEKAQEKFRLQGLLQPQWHHQDILNYQFSQADMILMIYTLQFVEKQKRAELLSQIYQNLNPGGVFVFAEKICSEDEQVHELTTEIYYDFKKRNGYSELEIAQKREALENVLIPDTMQLHLDRLRGVGFRNSELLFRWYNFACFVGFK